MSIRGTIAKLLNTKLFLFEHGIKSEGGKRFIIMSKEFADAFTVEFKHGVTGIRHAQVRAALEHFISGGRISIAMDPKDKPPETFLARTDPKSAEVWDIRVLGRGRIRVFGRFIEKDNYVALTWDYRENLNGRDFDKAVARFQAKWRELFPIDPIFGGKEAREYVSEPYYVV